MNIQSIAVGPFEANCFVAWESPSALVVDPGSDPETIIDLLRRNELGVAAYLLTHGHVDHVSAVAHLQREFPAPVCLHEADLTWAFTPDNAMPPMYPPPLRPPAGIRTLADGLSWTDGGIAWTVLSTPGHTPGSCCFHIPRARSIFTGDTLFAGSVGRTDLPGGDSRQLTASLRKLAALDPDTSVYPGHGPVTTIGQERRTNFFLRGM